MNNLIKIILLITIPLYSYCLHTITNKNYSKNQSYFDRILDKTEQNLNNIYININSYSKKFDEKLSNKKGKDIYEDTRIHLLTYYDLKQKDKNKLSSYFSFHIDLPLIEKKLSYVFHNTNNRKKDKKINASLKNSVYKRKDKHSKINIKAGIKIKTKPFLYFKAKVKKEYSNFFSINFKEEIRLFKNGHLHFRTNINFNKKINHFLSISNINSYRFNNKDKNDMLLNQIILNHKLSNKRYLRYLMGINSNDEDSNFKIKEYNFSIQHKYKIRKWLYINLEPKLTFNDDNNFKEEYSFRIALGMDIAR